MINSNNSIKTIVRRFVSLPPHTRVAIAMNLLRLNDETDAPASQSSDGSGARRKSFLEQFWDEVEAAHADGLYTTNPFTSREAQNLFYAAGRSPFELLSSV